MHRKKNDFSPNRPDGERITIGRACKFPAPNIFGFERSQANKKEPRRHSDCGWVEMVDVSHDRPHPHFVDETGIVIVREITY